MSNTTNGIFRHHVAVVLPLAAALSVGACSNAGEERVLAIESTGLVSGMVFFDLNGTREFEVQTDVLLGGVGVTLFVRGTDEVVVDQVSAADGSFQFSAVLAGRYDVVVDTATVGDTVGVIAIDKPQLVVFANDSVDFEVILTFPILSVGAARAAALNERLFIEGVVLNSANAFGDSTVHVSDSTGTIRTTRIAGLLVQPGDLVRFRGNRNVRDGQPTVDNVVPFVIGVSTVPPVERVLTAQATTADGGRLDAALIRVVDVTVTDTATVGIDLVMTADDGSGPLEIVVDGDANILLGTIGPGSLLDVTGLLVPTNSGTWQLKPRAGSDIVEN